MKDLKNKIILHNERKEVIYLYFYINNYIFYFIFKNLKFNNTKSLNSSNIVFKISDSLYYIYFILFSNIIIDFFYTFFLCL